MNHTTAPADVSHYYRRLAGLYTLPFWQLARLTEVAGPGRGHVWHWRDIYSEFVRSRVIRTGRGTTATGPGPRRADRRVPLGLLAAAATIAVASCLHLPGRIPPGFTAPVPATLGLRTTEVSYPGGTEHIRAVRADLRAALEGCPRADDVILCASELAANAAQHSRSRLPGGTFTVRATVSPDHDAQIEVRDDGGPWTQAVTDPARYHGLDIIRAVADAWGIEDGRATRTVWARFGWPKQP